MKIKISGGVKEQGIVIGNAYDKYNSQNPIVKWMMKGFAAALNEYVKKVTPQSIHEIGCGEGYWVLNWLKQGINAKGCDFSTHVIEIAKENALALGLSPSLFEVRNIYELDAERDAADLIICCEVLEHLDNPQAGLKALARVAGGHLIVSVPREPIWRVLNVLRGKYLKTWGNTPGHLQHWSKKQFIHLLSEYFEVLETRSPFPWTMLLCRPHR